jgi:hypothetical protein
MEKMIERIIRAITFKTEVYPEVSKDETFTTSAWIIVGAVALIAAIGGRAVMIRYNFVGYLLGIVVGTAVMVGAFALSVFVIKWLASTLYKVNLTFGELQRPLGLAYVFQAIQILGILGALSVALLCIVAPITLVAAVAGIIAYLFALKTVTNLSWGQVAVLVVVAWVIFLVVGGIVGAVFAVPAALAGL